MTNIVGANVLVTGASAGIGRETVKSLALAGANVHATARRESELLSLQAELAAEGRQIHIIPGDLNDPGFVPQLIAQVPAIDILVNNAGTLVYAPILESGDEDCERMFTLNVFAGFRLMREVAKGMVERRGGHIIVISSVAAREVYGLGAVYCATKHALSALSRGLRLELKEYGIRVSEIAPGMVDTGIRDTSNHPKVLASIKARTYLPIKASDVAEAVVYAASAPKTAAIDWIEMNPGQRIG